MADTMMTKEHKDNLQLNRKQIVASIRMGFILNDLAALKTLTRREVQEIKSKKGEERIECFMEILCTKPDSCYNTFLTVLRNNDHENIATILEPSEHESYSTAEAVTDSDHKNGLDARVFSEFPALLKILPVDGDIAGITVLNGQLFVVREGSSLVNVYDTDNFHLIQNIVIPGAWDLRAIVASSQYNCLYVSDPVLENVHRHDLNTGVSAKWPVGGMGYGLSLTSTYNVLVTVHSIKNCQVQEYEQDGSFVRVVNLMDSIKHPWQNVKLSSDFLVVCHGMMGSLHRVCIVDMSEHIIQAYGGVEGSGIKQLSNPCDLAVDKYDNVLVADHGNNRVMLLSPSLTHLGYITVPGHELSSPGALHLDKLNHRLYVAECSDPGRVYVLSLSVDI